MTEGTSMRHRGTVLTAMFTDIVDSARLKNEMPAATAVGRDEAYRLTIKEPHDERILRVVKSKGGVAVQSSGDGYLLTFDDVEQAVLCALDIQDSLRSAPIQTPIGPLQIRIGIHTGVSHTGGKVGGAAIDKASRVQAHGEPGAVFVSHETHVLVAQLRNVRFEETPAVNLKGLGPQSLFRASRVAAGSECNPPLAQRLARLAELQNPYDFATVANYKTFKGRRQEMEELLTSIETGTHSAIFGLQRMGKTSLIEQGLKAELETRPSLRNSVLVVKIDMQRLGGAQVTYKDFVHAIFEAIVEQLNAIGVGREVPNLRNLTRELLTPSRYERGDRTEFFSVFAKVLASLATASRRRLVLFIDEFSEIRKVIERNKEVLQKNPSRVGNLLPHDMYIDVPFIHHMSSLLKDSELRPLMTFIVLVRPFIAEYDAREGLQLLKLMKPIMLRHLDETAAKELITAPVESYIEYEDGAVDYLFRLTDGHPYLLQFMLKLVVDRMKRDAQPTITKADISWLRERMISEGPAYDAQFAVLISDYSVDEITHVKEAHLGKGLLALVSQLGQQQDGWVPSGDLLRCAAPASGAGREDGVAALAAHPHLYSRRGEPRRGTAISPGGPARPGAVREAESVSAILPEELNPQLYGTGSRVGRGCKPLMSLAIIGR
jgi:class 3 adenylate cyclase